MTLEEMRSDIRDALEEYDPDNLTDYKINRLLNEAQLDIVAKTKCLKTSSSTAITAGQILYSLPSDLLDENAIIRVEFDDDKLGYIDYQKIRDFTD